MHCINKDGEIITELSKNLVVDIAVEIAKEVPIRLVTSGKLAEDPLKYQEELLLKSFDKGSL